MLVWHRRHTARSKQPNSIGYLLPLLIWTMRLNLSMLSTRYSNLSLSGKLLLPLLSATFGLWSIGAFCVGYWQTSKMEQGLEERTLEFASQVEQNFAQRVEILELKARSITETTAVGQATAQKDRAKLLQVLLPVKTSLNLDLVKVVNADRESLIDLREDKLAALDIQAVGLDRSAIAGLSFTTILHSSEDNTAALVNLLSAKNADGITGGILFGTAFDDILLAELQADSSQQQLIFVKDSSVILSSQPDFENQPWNLSFARDSVVPIGINDIEYLATEVAISDAIESDVRLFVLYSTSGIAAIKQQFWLIIGGLGALGAGLTGVIGIWVTRLVTRRVGLLTQATENLAKGDFSIPVHVDGQDEVSHLAAGFNFMAGQVHEREQKIRAQMSQLEQAFQALESAKDKIVSQEKEYSRTLESKVEARTQELTNTLHELEQTKHELEIASHGLETQVEVRTQELTTALEELKDTQSQLIQTEKMSSLGQMVAGIAHEINNPISFIQGNIKPLNEYFQDLLSLLQTYRAEYPQPTETILEAEEDLDIDFVIEDTANTLNSMKLGTQRVRDIVVSLRNYSRLDEAAIKEVDIHEGIESTLLILNHRLKQGVEVIKNYGDVPKIRCSPAQLNQVYTNIIVNAVDAMFEADCSPKQLMLSTRFISSESVQVSIRDNGVGIPENIKKKIFDPFFTTKAVGKGTGLGLGICYKIIKQHRGDLEVNSEVGKGTEFLITLPKE